jgi:cation transport regulator ChaB
VPAKDELPSTLRRSPDKAQRTWSKAHDSAVETYGEGERAHRTAFAALKHTHQKIGDHWESKDGAGPSDERAASGVDPRTGRGPSGKTAGGVNANASKQELLEQARTLGVRGRSSMRKGELVDALRKASDRQTRQARERG